MQKVLSDGKSETEESEKIVILSLKTESTNPYQVVPVAHKPPMTLLD